jgi:hypothetical protein
MATIRTFPISNTGYTADHIADLFDMMTQTGIISGYDSEMKVQPAATPNMTVEVLPGGAIIRGRGYHHEAGSGNVSHSVPANSSGSTRKDRVVLRLDTTQTGVNVLRTVYVTGTSSPPSPTRTSTVYDSSLAQISVANGATSIVAANITDERFDPTVGGYAVTRGLAPVANPQYPFSLAQPMTHRLIGSSSSGVTYTINAGEHGYILGGRTAGGISITISNGVIGFVGLLGSGATSGAWEAGVPIPLGEGWTVFVGTNNWVKIVTMPKSATRTPVLAARTTNGDIISTAANQRLTICWWYTSSSNIVRDKINVNDYYLWTNIQHPLTNGVVGTGFSGNAVVGPTQPQFVGPSRTLESITANVPVTMVGYLETFADSVVNA